MQYALDQEKIRMLAAMLIGNFSRSPDYDPVYVFQRFDFPFVGYWLVTDEDQTLSQRPSVITRSLMHQMKD